MAMHGCCCKLFCTTVVLKPSHDEPGLDMHLPAACSYGNRTSSTWGAVIGPSCRVTLALRGMRTCQQVATCAGRRTRQHCHGPPALWLRRKMLRNVRRWNFRNLHLMHEVGSLGLQSSSRQQWAHDATLIGVCCMMSKLLGSWRQQLVSSQFGLSSVADAFTVTACLPLLSLAVFGSLNGPLHLGCVALVGHSHRPRCSSDFRLEQAWRAHICPGHGSAECVMDEC
jgi:hypothetical protein